MPDEPRPDRLDPEVLGRYLTGTCTAAEREIVARMCAEHPDVTQRLAAYLSLLDGEATRPAPPETDASWATLRARIRDASEARPSVNTVTAAARQAVPRPQLVRAASRAPRLWRHITSAAASVLIGVGIVTVWLAHRPHDPSDAATFVTAPLERARVRLADGTRVRIAPGSRVRIAPDYGSRRDVYLEGEAYFEVVHDPQHPFTVHAGNTTARDLGTAFAVRNYREDDGVRVAVRQGLVSLSGVGQLAAGDVGRLTSAGKASVERHANVAVLLAWVDGRLEYRDAPLAQVLGDLRRWDAVDVQLADPTLARLPFTGTLTGDSPAAAVSLVAATLGLRVSGVGDHLVLGAPRGAPRTSRSVPAVRREP